MQIVHDDGGRKDAGYIGHAGDCVTRAIAIATQKPYQEVYDALHALCKTQRLIRDRKSPRNGVSRKVYEKYLTSIGWKWVPCMKIGSGCKVHLKSEELPAGRIICRLSGHMAAVVDGILHDMSDCSRNGTRCVYGYFQKG